MKNDHEKLAEMIKDITFTMMTTIGETGQLHTRPMATMDFGNVQAFDGNLWFFTRKDSLKVHDIVEDKEVSLAYSHPTSQRYVAVNGLATVVSDQNKMRELWTPTLKAWFPEGLADPQIALIKVTVESAEIWDSPPGAVVKLVGMAKAMLTGKPYDNNLGEHRQIGRSH
jgi:general stress protein 26